MPGGLHAPNKQSTVMVDSSPQNSTALVAVRMSSQILVTLSCLKSCGECWWNYMPIKHEVPGSSPGGFAI